MPLPSTPTWPLIWRHWRSKVWIVQGKWDGLFWVDLSPAARPDPRWPMAFVHAGARRFTLLQAVGWWLRVRYARYRYGPARYRPDARRTVRINYRPCSR